MLRRVPNFRLFTVILCAALAALVVIHGPASAETDDMPPLAMVVFPPEAVEDWTVESLDAAYSSAKSLGATHSTIYYAWGEIERSVGWPDWDDIDYSLDLIARNGMKASVILKPIDTNAIGELPDGVDLHDFRDPEIIDLFVRFADALLDRHQGKVEYLWIGNEIDVFLAEHPQAAEDYRLFYQSVVERLTTNHPDVKIGTITTYHDAMANQNMDDVISIARHGDYLGFTYYPETMSGVSGEDVAGHLEEMARFAADAGCKWVVTESGWSTQGRYGSEDLQATFVRQVLLNVPELDNQPEYYGWFILYDMHPDLARDVAGHFGMGPENQEFVNFVGTQGLGRNDGTHKPAWAELQGGDQASANNARVLPEDRPFYMGFSPFPYDYSLEAIRETYANLDRHGDIVAHHFDNGVPWEEALAGQNYSNYLLEDVETRIQLTADGQAIYLALTPLSDFRTELAKYWHDKENQDLPQAWQRRWEEQGFAHPDIIEAYLNFCRYMIDRFQPEFFNYLIEANTKIRPGDPEFDRLLTLASRVYPALKAEYPDLPIFLSLDIDSPDLDAGWIDSARQLLRYSDWIAVSVYPHLLLADGEDADPSRLSGDLLSQVAELDPEKPFAVAEVGFMAQDMEMATFNVRMHGTKEWQEKYLAMLLDQCHALDAELLIWFVMQDYDRVFDLMIEFGIEDWIAAWRDTGLIDEAGAARPSLALWDAWLGLTRR